MTGASRGGPVVLVYHPEGAAPYAALVRSRRRLAVHACSTRVEAAPLVADAEVLYAWQFPPELYEKASRLRWLQAIGAGVEWALVPGLPAGVTVTRAPGVFGPWMAEYVVGWCSWVTQRMETYLEAKRRRRWIADAIPDRLRGKTLVIVGFGDIGRTIARAAHGLGMRVLGVSRSGRPARPAERVYPLRDLQRALAAADFAVLVLPLTDETRGLVGARELRALRSTAWLLNIGRGAVVDDAALVDALAARRLAGAILDVFPTEPLPPAHPLWALDNAVITPHIAGPSTPEEIAPIFNDNLARFLAGRPLRHVVDRARGY
jgi:phosphoglycerate dehydrogenase-like enzyme